MQITSDKHTSREAQSDDRLRISTESLTDAQIQSIRKFLEEDPRIDSVDIGPLSSFIELPTSAPKVRPKEGGYQFLTLEISASAEIGALIVNFIKNNKDAIDITSGLVGIGSPVALGGKYVVKRLQEFCKSRKGKFSKVPLYDPKGNVIKWVKRKTK